MDKIDILEKKVKEVKNAVKWAEEESKRPEYQNDTESLAFFKGIIFLKKYVDED